MTLHICVMYVCSHEKGVYCVCRCHWYDDPVYVGAVVMDDSQSTGTCSCTHPTNLHIKNSLTLKIRCTVCPCEKKYGEFLRGEKFVQETKERNPTFNRLLDELKTVHESKSHDYAEDENVYSNFEFAARYAGVTVDQVFDVLLGIKQARKLNLVKAGKIPKNEPILDTYKDRTVYSGLAASYYIDNKDKEGPGRP